MKALSLGLTAAALLALGVAAHADDVIELELDGTAVNNTLATAQVLPASAFTPNASPNVFGLGQPTATVLGRGGGDDVDFFAFNALAGPAYFDIDNDPFSFDTILSLFDSTGTLLAFDDDSFPGDPGTQNGLDSFLGVYNLPADGTYYITVSQFANFPNAVFSAVTFNDLTRPDGEIGGSAVSGVVPGDSSFRGIGTQTGSPYRLNITTNVVNPVPEPGSVALVGGMVTLGGLALRRRARK